MRLKRHTPAAHANGSRHNVQGGTDGADAAEQNTQRPIVGTVPGREDFCRQWSIGKPADVRRRASTVEAIASQKTEVQKQTAEGRYPKAESV